MNNREFELTFDASLSDIPHARQRILAFRFDSPQQAARELPWQQFVSEITGKSITVLTGAYRNIPTSLQLQHAYRSFDHIEPYSETTALIADPSRNIRIYKQPGIVFPWPLRKEFWAHVPGLQIVVQNRPFGKRSPFKYWQETHKQLRRLVKQYRAIYSSDAPFADQRAEAIGYDAINITLYQDYRPRERKKETQQMTTTDMDRYCSGTNKFIEIATRFLVTGQG